MKTENFNEKIKEFTKLSFVYINEMNDFIEELKRVNITEKQLSEFIKEITIIAISKKNKYNENIIEYKSASSILKEFGVNDIINEKINDNKIIATEYFNLLSNNIVNYIYDYEN